MDRKHKISIPEPCHEKQDKMTPKDKGRFCLNCTKTVIDFTKMLSEEIQQYFISNPNKSICGRFKNTQLDKSTLQIPNRVLYLQTQYYKMFLLALFIAMGTTLFSCTNKDGKKQKTDKAVIVADTATKAPIVTGKVSIDKNNSGHPAPQPPIAKTDQVKFIKPEENLNNKGKVKKHSTSKKEKEAEAKVKAGVNKNADLPGGIEQFYTFFGNEFKNPESADNTSNKLTISFAVEPDGSLTYLKPQTAIDAAIEKEIIRVLKLSPKWQPGESNGKKIRMQYSLPIVLQ